MWLFGKFVRAIAHIVFCLFACLHHVLAGELGDCANGIAFPWECGRGIGGQGWPQYAAILSDFAARMPFKTLVVRVPTDDENSNKQYLDS